jgi:hypothetical protein
MKMVGEKNDGRTGDGSTQQVPVLGYSCCKSCTFLRHEQCNISVAYGMSVHNLLNFNLVPARCSPGPVACHSSPSHMCSQDLNPDCPKDSFFWLCSYRQRCIGVSASFDTFLTDEEIRNRITR